ncbi:Bestrophin, RFP-TM, chloride channel-domain-containing protein [Dendryphion nanum]|uniref:Bestrophin, RFP-TM, chloride channel-domain-containing protein n=1 Tax=Dendryphion nanum TaxID=256645 RepID=A0A9P9DK89_9PLEO|nr:Bestrophin, RFP-TM, chloride channel-domain-containing protein [Dendryphion nanum]
MASSTSTDGGKTLRPSEIEIPEGRRRSDSGEGRAPMSPLSWRAPPIRPAPTRQDTNGTEIDDYFVGPRDMSKHSKWPFFLRMHGSVLPKMILPLTVVAGWSTLITLISHFVFPLKVSNLLLTVLGFVVGMAISFRTSSAYERYTEGRKYWSQLLFVGQNLARTIWIHSYERDGELGKEDLLAKISALNLIVAYSRAVMHKIRFEPGIDYDRLEQRVAYLDTFAKAAQAHIPARKEYGKMKSVGEYLGVTFAESNPRKRVKQSKKPLGNLPLEILTHLSSYVHSLIENDTMKVGLYQNQAINMVVQLNEMLIGVDRVLQTPLPIAYSIAISQITWVYVMMLPFQLWENLQWVTIPGCIFAGYIILGLAAIGREIENPFGMDVNDLPLESYCEELEMDLDIIMSQSRPKPGEFMKRAANMPMYPLDPSGYDFWSQRSKQAIRDALMTKTKADMKARRSINPDRPSMSADEKHHLHNGPQQQQEA